MNDFNGIADAALADRGDGGACGMPRIPTGRFPVWSTTLTGLFDANGDAEIEYLAERDTLLTNLSIDGGTNLPAAGAAQTVDAEYCNTKYLRTSLVTNWSVCCDRKPVFLVGVRENKRLKFTVHGGTPDETAAITISGFQGNGCCGGPGGPPAGNGLAGIALGSGAACGTDRIPTAAWPLYSQGFLRTIAVAATQPADPIEFEAERDTTFTDLAVRVTDDVTNAELPALVSITYCNTQYVDGTVSAEFNFCCQRRPLFLVGVRENKRLRVDVTLTVAAVNAATVQVELTGFQGNGCCA